MKNKEKKAKQEVRERDNFTCVRCGSTYGIQVSHVYSVGSKSHLRANKDNLKVLCYQCHHLWWHSKPIEAMEWFKETYPDRFERLQDIIKGRK